MLEKLRRIERESINNEKRLKVVKYQKKGETVITEYHELEFLDISGDYVHFIKPNGDTRCFIIANIKDIVE